MQKTAIVYDKWLSTLGGGEVVACNIAKVLLDLGYKVTFVMGKSVTVSEIKRKLNIDLSDASFAEIWNDELTLQNLTKGVDIYVNATFMDYTRGFAKKNYYYVFFPTPLGRGLLNGLKNKLYLPMMAKIIRPRELLSNEERQVVLNNNFGWRLAQEPLKIAFYNLTPGNKCTLNFQVFFSNFDKSNLEGLHFSIKNGDILNQEVICDHRHNVLRFRCNVLSSNSTLYVYWKQTNGSDVFLINPNVEKGLIGQVLRLFGMTKIKNRLRAGVFQSPLLKIRMFHLLADSKFTQKWINRYWQCSSTLLYPPVEMFFLDRPIDYKKKRNWICHVGRFFTMGHGKKQEILIETFKQLCDDGLSDWELHLAGGVGSETNTQAFVNYLRKLADGYPIFFHFNCTRSEIINLYYSSRIYWHATGFGENENKEPIKMEHFGISPIEAMSAGCIPVLYKAGGLPETVYNLGGDERYLFTSINDLKSKTLLVIDNINEIFLTNERQQIMENLYSLQSFKNQLIRMFKQD